MAHFSRTCRLPALASGLAVLLGLGVVPAIATSSTAINTGHLTRTTLKGFSTASAAVAVGGTVADPVSIRPRAHRLVRVQARRPGATTFVTVSSGFSSKAGDFRAVYHPTAPGTWHFRLMLPATSSATSLVSAVRAITANGDTAAPGPVTGLTVTQGIDSELRLSWTNPDDTDFAGVMIRRFVGSTAPQSPTAGVLVTTTNATATAFDDLGLSGGTTYSYALFAVDNAKNKAPGAVSTAVSGATTTAALSLHGSTGTTAKQTVNQSEAFDIGGTHAGRSLTLVSGSLDYGDGTAVEKFTGDPSTWVPSAHQYSALGTFTATWTVVDSGSRSVNKTVQVHVFSEPTATITVDPASALEKNKPITFHVTSATPSGTSFTDFDHFNDAGAHFVSGTGAPPATFTITFANPGTYTVFVEGFTDAGGLASASVQVVVIDAPKP